MSAQARPQDLARLSLMTPAVLVPVDCAALSDIGRVRARNEDSLAWDRDLGLFVLADGIGGHRAGHIASRLAVEAVLASLRDAAPHDAARLERALVRAHSDIADAALANNDYDGMGTTLLAVALCGSTLQVAHVGDSRLYQLRDGQLARLTRDHTVAEEWPGAGDDPRHRNQLTRALGLGRQVMADHAAHPLRLGDRYLLCSDGLTAHLPDAELAAWMGAPLSADLRAHALIDLANQRGGEDNASLILFDVGHFDA